MKEGASSAVNAGRNAAPEVPVSSPGKFLQVSVPS